MEDYRDARFRESCGDNILSTMWVCIGAYMETRDDTDFYHLNCISIANAVIRGQLNAWYLFANMLDTGTVATVMGIAVDFCAWSEQDMVEDLSLREMSRE